MILSGMADTGYTAGVDTYTIVFQRLEERKDACIS
jgi:hypothetical protein